MQGFVLQMTPVKHQDLIVRVLTQNRIIQAYRFYGMRHSLLGVGRKLDFDLEGGGVYLPKMHNLFQLGYVWEGEYARVYVWQTFVKLLNTHLRDVEEVEEFYFDLLERGGLKMVRQNPIRVGLEMSAELLKYEGRSMRMHYNACFVCGEGLGERVSLGRAFLFAHQACIGGDVFEKERILRFLERGSSLELEDFEVERLWSVFALGL